MCWSRFQLNIRKEKQNKYQCIYSWGNIYKEFKYLDKHKSDKNLKLQHPSAEGAEHFDQTNSEISAGVEKQTKRMLNQQLHLLWSTVHTEQAHCLAEPNAFILWAHFLQRYQNNVKCFRCSFCRKNYP